MRIIRQLGATGAALAAVLAMGAASATTLTWAGGIGIWSDAIRWTPNSVPGSGDTARIDGGKTGTSSTVSVANTSPAVFQLVVDAGDTVILESGRSMTVQREDAGAQESGIANQGEIRLNAAALNPAGGGRAITSSKATA